MAQFDRSMIRDGAVVFMAAFPVVWRNVIQPVMEQDVNRACYLMLIFQAISQSATCPDERRKIIDHWYFCHLYYHDFVPKMVADPSEQMQTHAIRLKSLIDAGNEHFSVPLRGEIWTLERYYMDVLQTEVDSYQNPTAN